MPVSLKQEKITVFSLPKPNHKENPHLHCQFPKTNINKSYQPHKPIKENTSIHIIYGLFGYSPIESHWNILSKKKKNDHSELESTLILVSLSPQINIRNSPTFLGFLSGVWIFHKSSVVIRIEGIDDEEEEE